MTHPIATAVHQAEFLTTLFATLDGSLIELRLIDDDESKKENRHADCVFCETVEQVLAQLPKSRQQQYGHGVCVGVCPRTQPKGTKDSVTEVWWLWADLDGKDFPGGKAEALRRIRQFPLPVTMLTDTGHGYHPYWRLNQPHRAVANSLRVL